MQVLSSSEDEKVVSYDTKVNIDAILRCLELFTKLFHQHYSTEALISGLPLDPSVSELKIFSIGSSKSLFSRAADRAGLKSTLVKKEIQSFIPIQLPFIALLQNNNACIVEQFNEDQTQLKLIFADDEMGTESWISVDAFSQQYLGFGFLLKKAYQRPDDKHSHIHRHHRHWFFDTLKMSSKIYSDVLVGTLLVNLFVLATPLFTMNVYDRVIPNNAQETLMVFTIGVLFVYILDAFLKYGRTYLLEIAAKKSDVIMSSMIFEKVLDLKLDQHPQSIGSFASNLKEFDSIRSFFTNATLATLIDMPFAIIFLAVIYYIGGMIVLIPLLTIVLIILYALLIRKPLARSIESSYEASAKKNGVLIEALQNIETIKTHNASSSIQYRWEESVGEIAQKGLKSRLLSSSIPTVTGLLVQINTVLIVFYGVFLIQEFELTMGGLIAVVILTSRTVAPMGQAAGLITAYEDAKTAFMTLEDVMNKPQERPLAKEFIDMPHIRGKIEFRHVSFSYPQSDKVALDDVSFIIEPGESVGIIGRIGSGKSTLEKLILGLYEPSAGSILIDDIEIGQIDPVQLRRAIGYVPQEVTLFKGTVKENITLKTPYISDDALIRASHISGALEFIQQHPLGFAMPISERQQGLSGGQRQSVAIAQALVAPSAMLLFDEPTNAMDQLSEQRVIKNLKPQIEEKTFFLVTQKMDLLPLVQRVVVMHHGKVFLDGQRDDVIKSLQGGSNA